MRKAIVASTDARMEMPSVRLEQRREPSEARESMASEVMRATNVSAHAAKRGSFHQYMR